MLESTGYFWGVLFVWTAFSHRVMSSPLGAPAAGPGAGESGSHAASGTRLLGAVSGSAAASE